MRPEAFESELKSRLGGKHVTPDQVVDVMLQLYADQRAENCPVEEDGDMLLYQWGDYGSGFEWNLTRQFITNEETDDDAISQLSVTLMFRDVASIESGNYWCSSPDELGEFRKFILASPAYAALEGRSASPEIHYGGV